MPRCEVCDDVEGVEICDDCLEGLLSELSEDDRKRMWAKDGLATLLDSLRQGTGVTDNMMRELMGTTFASGGLIKTGNPDTDDPWANSIVLNPAPVTIPIRRRYDWPFLVTKGGS